MENMTKAIKDAWPLRGRTKALEYIVTEKGCWECVSHATDSHGYPLIQRGGHRTLAHRYVYELTTKTIEDGLCLLHSCDNTLCINPSHMFEGTRADNMYDKARKGRSSAGESRPLAKLTQEGVLQIREHYKTLQFTQQELANMFGVSRSLVSRVVNEKAWRSYLNGNYKR